MIRVIWFLAKVTLLALIAVWFAEYPGKVEFEWHGYIVDTYVGIVVLIVLCVAWLISTGFGMIARLIQSPTMISDWYEHKQLASGYRALTQGMVAVAAGDADAALKFSQKAQAILKDPPLTLLLTAQAAQLNGNEKVAEKYFKEMLAFPEMDFLGMRGLLMQSLKKGDSQAALLLARKASQLKKKSRFVFDVLFELECRDRNWTGALKAFDDHRKLSDLTFEAARRKKAILLMEIAREEQRLESVQTIVSNSALKKMSQALSLAPSCVPVVLEYVQFHVQAVKIKHAVRAIEDCWPVVQHPALLDVYKNLREAGHSLPQIKFMQRLIEKGPETIDGHYALAQLYVRASLFGQARDHLSDCMKFKPTKKVYLLYAELERQQFQDEVTAREWLMKAAAAPEDPVWFCGSCYDTGNHWQAVCSNCGDFDAYEFGMPHAKKINREHLILEKFDSHLSATG